MKKLLLLTLCCLVITFSAQAEFVEITNPNFDTDTTGWTPVNCAIACVTSVLEMTRVSGDFQHVYQDITTEIGKTYKLTASVKSGSSGDETGRLYAKLDASTYSATTSFTTTSSFVPQSLIFVALSTTTRIYLDKFSATPGTMLYDSVAVWRFPTYRVYYTTSEYHEYSGEITHQLNGTLLTIYDTSDPVRIYRFWKWLEID